MQVKLWWWHLLLPQADASEVMVVAFAAAPQANASEVMVVAFAAAASGCK